jgi:hypothetical protein
MHRVPQGTRPLYFHRLQYNSCLSHVHRLALIAYQVHPLATGDVQ